MLMLRNGHAKAARLTKECSRAPFSINAPTVDGVFLHGRFIYVFFHKVFVS